MFCTRREFNELVEALVYDDSDTESSSDDDDVELLLLHVAFPPTEAVGARLCIDDLSDHKCERLFRYGG